MNRPKDQGKKDQLLIEKAREARRAAYAPYSKFKVGAALRLRDGQVFAGCNVENASYGAGICAERNAICQAVLHGMRLRQLEAIAVYTTDKEPTPPCGICLQVLVEFGRDVDVLLSNGKKVKKYKLLELLTTPFTSLPSKGK